MAKDAFFALSLAGLCLITVWTGILQSLDPHHLYFLRDAPYWGYYATAAVNLLILAAVFLLAVWLVRRSASPRLRTMAAWGFLVILLLPLNSARLNTGLADRLAALGRPGLIVLALIGIALLPLVHRRLDSVARAARTVVLALGVFAVLMLGRSIFAVYRFGVMGGPLFQSVGTADYLEGRPATRVLWLIYDEMDQAMTFTERPDSIDLPELDRLRSQALFATDASSPAFSTRLSLPSLLTGIRYGGGRGNGPRSLRLELLDADTTVDFGAVDNVFGRARRQGVNGAVAGWFHPYCRLFEELARCSWYPLLETDTVGPFAATGRQLVLTGASVPLGYRIGRALGLDLRISSIPLEQIETEQHLRQHLRIVREGIEAATDPRIGLTVMHLPVPHRPVIYDRHRGEYDTDMPGSRYLDNLVLADRTLGEVRAALEREGLWDVMAVIITSDHPNRNWIRGLYPREARDDFHAYQADVGRVPLIIKLPGQHEGVEYTAPVNAVVTPDMVLDLLAGEIDQPEALMSWLERRAAADR